MNTALSRAMSNSPFSTKLIGTQGTHGARMPLIGELDAQSTDAVAEWIRSGAHRCKR